MILNKIEQKKAKAKSTLCWLRAEGPESTDKMCNVYREMNEWDIARG